jgi:H+/Cl- antiporter ClcA
LPSVSRRKYAILIGHSALLGLFGGLLTVLYLLAIEGGVHVLWGETDQMGWFSGSWQMLVIPTVAGLVAGFAYRRTSLPARFKGFIAELEEGEVEPSTAPGALLVAVVSLIGGASLGPEAPVGTGGGAAGTWLARRRGADDAGTRALTFAGMSAAFGGLVSSPLGGPLLAFELEHEQSSSYYYSHLIPGIVAGAVGFGVVYPVVGAPFVGLYDIPASDFNSWMLIAAVAIGIVGFAVAMGLGRIIVPIVAWFRRLDDRPVARGFLGGLGVAVTGFALPLTLFSGQTALAEVLEDPGAIGWLTLASLIVVKAVALGSSLGGGFYGGPIFPIFFMGGILGALIHVLFPLMPLGLAVACSMAALGSAAAFIPLSLTILATLIVGANFLVFGAVLLAATTAFVLRYSLLDSGGRAAVQTAADAQAGRRAGFLGR